MELSNYVTQLSCLAHETRLALYRLLVKAGSDGLTPGEMIDDLSIPAATLSFHLRELKISKLATSQKAGRSVYYSANYQTMAQLMSFLTENCCAGSKRHQPGLDQNQAPGDTK